MMIVTPPPLGVVLVMAIACMQAREMFACPHNPDCSQHDSRRHGNKQHSHLNAEQPHDPHQRPSPLKTLPGWSGRVPDWLYTLRTHAHTRLSPPNHYCNATTGNCSEVFDHAGKLFSSLNVSAYVRHSHQGNDKNWWKHGPEAAWEDVVRVTGRNLPKDFIDEAHSLNMRMILYHYPRCNQYYSSSYPDWLCRDPEGQPVKYPRGNSLCINSPWRQEYFSQIRELIDFGADGLYFDEFPQPPQGCWCKYCRAKFKAWSGGKDMPLPNDTARYPEMLRFNSESVIEYFQELAEVVANQSAEAKKQGLRDEDAVPFFSTHTLPCPDNSRLLFETGQIVSGAPIATSKIEFDTADGVGCNVQFKPGANYSGMAFANEILVPWGWSYGRDIAQGNPPHDWFPNAKTAQLVNAAVGAMLSYGIIANPDHTESQIPNFDVFSHTYAKAKELEPFFQPLRVSRWAAVVFSEGTRDSWLPYNDQTLWQRNLAPALGAWQALLQHGAPAGIIADWQLDSASVSESYLSQFKVIIVPPANLTERQRQTLDRIPVIKVTMNDTDPWIQLQDRQRLSNVLWQNVSSQVRPPVRRSQPAFNNSLDFHVVTHDNVESSSEFAVVATNQFTWAGERQKQNNPPPPIHNARVILRINSEAKQLNASDAIHGGVLNLTRVPSSMDEYELSFPAFQDWAAAHIRCDVMDCLAN